MWLNHYKGELYPAEHTPNATAQAAGSSKVDCHFKRISSKRLHPRRKLIEKNRSNDEMLMRSHVGARLHGVSQVTAEEAGLVLSVVAAGQLAQALRTERREWF